LQDNLDALPVPDKLTPELQARIDAIALPLTDRPLRLDMAPAPWRRQALLAPPADWRARKPWISIAAAIAANMLAKATQAYPQVADSWRSPTTAS